MKKLLGLFEKDFKIPVPEGMLPEEGLVPLDGKPVGESLLFGTPTETRTPIDPPLETVKILPDGYCVVGYWGHGINSYAFQYNRKNSWSEFSLRIPFGGVYMDNKANAEVIEKFFTEYFKWEANFLKEGLDKTIHLAAFDNMGQGFYEIGGSNKKTLRVKESLINQTKFQQQFDQTLEFLA